MGKTEEIWQTYYPKYTLFYKKVVYKKEVIEWPKPQESFSTTVKPV